MHRFAEIFEDHAVLKGGMALRLVDCPRRTVEIDYVFVPFRSKKEIADRVTEVLHEIDGAVVDVNLHSKMLRAGLRIDDAAIQVEVSVSDNCETIPMAPQRVRRDLVTARTDWWYTAWSGLVAYGLVIGLSDMPSTRCGRISPPAPLRWQPMADRYAQHLLTPFQT